jgi:hypothetical protein
MEHRTTSQVQCARHVADTAPPQDVEPEIADCLKD